MNAMIDPFVMASAKGAAWLLVWSWQAAVLIASVWAGLKVLRVKSPALRHQVWLFALIAVVAMPVLGSVVQRLPLPQPDNRALKLATELPKIVVTNDAAPVVQNPSPATIVKPSIKRPIILSLSFVLWLVGSLIFVTKAAINGVRLRRLKAGARLISLVDLECDECDCGILRSGKARLALADEIRSPILLGVLRPMIVFPADIFAWTSPEERFAMLRHELAHVERWDHYVNLFQTLIGVIFFFHPLARHACRQLAVEREMACDDHVVDAGAEAETYAESLIKAAERSIGAPRGAHQLALFGTRQILERRIEMILNRNRVRAIARPWRYLIAPAALITFVAWILIPVAPVKSTLAQAQAGSVTTPGPEVVEYKMNPIVTFYSNGQQGSAKYSVARKASGDKGPEQTAPAPPAPPTVLTGAEAVPQSMSKRIVPPEEVWSFFASPSGEDETRQMGRMIQFVLSIYNSNFLTTIPILESALDDDYFGIDPKGVVYNKAQQIEALKNRKPDNSTWGQSSLDISINGNQAIGAIDYTNHHFGGELTEEYHFTVTLVRREKLWKVSSIQATQKQ